MINQRGYTLIELIISISIMTILLILVFSSLFLGVSSFKSFEQELDNTQNCRYAIDYISSEVRRADEILPVELISDINTSIFRDNFGFLIRVQEANSKSRYILYYKELNQPIIRRCVATYKDNEREFKASRFSGFNEIADNVLQIERNTDITSSNILKISITVSDNKNIESTLSNEIFIISTVGDE